MNGVPGERTAKVAISRLESFGRVASTQDIVRDWLADGLAEVCVAVADEQSEGRGRLGRAWHAPPGRALLVSAGFRPTSLPLARAWQLPAVASLAMLEAASSLLGSDARLALKWPNDLVAPEPPCLRKVGGLLAESASGGDRLDRVVIGLGLNVDWPASEFPPDLAEDMSSLVELAREPVDRGALLEAWLPRLLDGYEALLGGRFDGPAWSAAQVTTGARLAVLTAVGRLEGVGAGVDVESGALLLRQDDGEVHSVAAGDVTACRLRSPGARA